MSEITKRDSVRAQVHGACSALHFLDATRKASDLSFEETQDKVTEWRRDHNAKLVPCRLHHGGILPEHCLKRQLQQKRVYVNGSRNTFYSRCSELRVDGRCPLWLSDEEYLKEFIKRNRKKPDATV